MSVETCFLMICNEDFDPKNRTFWVFGGGGKENGAWNMVYWVLNKNGNLRELTHGGVITSLK